MNTDSLTLFHISTVFYFTKNVEAVKLSPILDPIFANKSNVWSYLQKETALDLMFCDKLKKLGEKKKKDKMKRKILKTFLLKMFLKKHLFC